MKLPNRSKNRGMKQNAPLRRFSSFSLYFSYMNIFLFSCKPMILFNNNITYYLHSTKVDNRLKLVTPCLPFKLCYLSLNQDYTRAWVNFLLLKTLDRCCLLPIDIPYNIFINCEFKCGHIKHASVYLFKEKY